jgi:predicted permease
MFIKALLVGKLSGLVSSLILRGGSLRQHISAFVILVSVLCILIFAAFLLLLGHIIGWEFDRGWVREQLNIKSFSPKLFSSYSRTCL